MYLQHFSLREFPFGLTPDTGFAYRAQACQAALNTVLLSLQGGDGFIKVTGEVGTGKTLMCRMLLEKMVTGTVSAYLPNPKLHPHEMLRSLAQDLGLRVVRLRAENDLYHAVERKLLALAGEGRRVVMCVDEAQELPLDTLESLRLLSNLETGKQKLIQIVLFGQPEFDTMLKRPALRSLASRVGFSARLGPLGRSDCHAYLRHRLGVAGWSGPEVFTNAAARLLWRASAGVPRRANTLAHKALLLAYGRGVHRVDVFTVWHAWRDEQSLLGALNGLFTNSVQALFGRFAQGAH